MFNDADSEEDEVERINLVNQSNVAKPSAASNSRVSNNHFKKYLELDVNGNFPRAAFSEIFNASLINLLINIVM